MRALRLQLLAAFMAFAVSLPGTALARTQFFCHMMNRVVATCCCDSDVDVGADTGCGPQVRASDCCEKMTTVAQSATARALAKDVTVPPATIAAMVPAPVYVFSRTVTALALPAQARAPPALGPPLFVLNCSFLT